MCPEYGATVGFFPVDQNTLSYLQQTSMLSILFFLNNIIPTFVVSVLLIHDISHCMFNSSNFMLKIKDIVPVCALSVH